MLDTILSILSILGIILLVLLGLVLAILLIVLFFPITYGAEGQKNEDTFWVKAKVNWLFRLIRVRFAYPEPGNVVVKALWITLYDSAAKKKEEDTPDDAAAQKAESETAETVNTETGTLGSDAEYAQTMETAGDARAPGDAETEAAKAEAGKWESANTESAGATNEGAEENAADTSDDSAQASEKKPGLRKVISDKIEKIKYTILNIYGKIKYIWDNIQFYKGLLQEEQTQVLLRHLGLRLKKILWAIRPRKINADIVFGASSPDTTGYCMAVYGVLSPILGKKVRLTPDFEQSVFRGEFSLAGHITLFTVLLHACIFALDKKLWILIKKVKKFHKKEESAHTAT